ncbi:GDP-L-fucose synthase family protein [Cohnella silvisoli]|uniref:GDP-L-fucose synthase n=1 Tax=Cohnella silvisoli TaxID=2873699 RepID=A0ABV1KWC5_9BACL|nr:GDP-L-fucose synthase [Cohnella silvisoli]MCD9023679.1 GDP-L-fucose synthase [Cohnella silvisoli]
MDKNSKIYVAGHKGMVGSAIVRKLQSAGYFNIVCRTSRELDLRNPVAVSDFFQKESIEYVFLAAAKVGGIVANRDYPAEFIRDNLLIQTHVIDAAYKNKVTKLIFLGSSCIYPKHAPQPLKEQYLLSGALEPTNEPYAVAKIAGITMCQAYNRQYGTNFISVMPTNLYGPYDNFDTHTSHVLPALLRKMHDAKMDGQPVVEIWGTGKPYREFLHVDDLADACLFLMNHYNDQEIINVGVGDDISIAELAHLVSAVTGYEGQLLFNSDMPDGTPKKQLDITKISELGWRARIPLRAGIENTYTWYLKSQQNLALASEH